MKMQLKCNVTKKISKPVTITSSPLKTIQTISLYPVGVWLFLLIINFWLSVTPSAVQVAWKKMPTQHIVAPMNDQVHFYILMRYILSNEYYSLATDSEHNQNSTNIYWESWSYLLYMKSSHEECHSWLHHCTCLTEHNDSLECGINLFHGRLILQIMSVKHFCKWM